MGRGMREERKGKEGKATQPSCDEPNPRGTEGAKASPGGQKGQRRTQAKGEQKGRRQAFCILKGYYSPLFWRGAGVRLHLKYSSSSFSALASEFGRSLMMEPFSMRAMRELMSMVCWRLWLEMRMVAPVCLL